MVPVDGLTCLLSVVSQYDLPKLGLHPLFTPVQPLVNDVNLDRV